MNTWRMKVALFVVLASLACSLGGPGPTPTTQPAVTTPQPETTTANGIYVSLGELNDLGSNKVEINVGGSARMAFSFEPQVFEIRRDDLGNAYVYIATAWEPHPDIEMRVCTALTTPCTPTGEWTPLVLEQELEVPLDWLGPRVFWLVTEFREVGGAVVPSRNYYTEPAERSEDSIEIVGVVADGAVIEDLPAPVQTAVAVTAVAYPVQATAVIEGGICCQGGAAGAQIPLDVEFTATSPFGEVTEMRVSMSAGCRTEAELADTAWEPFQPTKTYQIAVVINWVGHYVSAQFRDAAGNLSPVVCDDISVEGMPASTP